MSNFIKEVVNSKVNYLKSSFEANNLVHHQGVKGSLNEILLKEIIKDVVPSKYKFANGVIQDRSGKQSNESDLIIYDDEILPSILFGGELGFVPAESVKYNIEVKTKLNATEIKSTVSKFTNANERLGYKGINSLFGFSSDLTQKHELARYLELSGAEFFCSPQIKVLTILDKGYYFLNTQRVYIKELMSKNEFVKMCIENSQAPLVVDGVELNITKDTNIELKGDFIVNGINFDELYVDRHFWVGTDVDRFENTFMLCFLSGISNTLSQGVFGKYLIEPGSDMTVYSECIVDMWGNVSHKKFDINGIEKSIFEGRFNFSFSLNQNGKGNTLKFVEKNT
ncbi:hypothetical protein AB3A53_004331 [Vibrio vulnificus]